MPVGLDDSLGNARFLLTGDGGIADPWGGEGDEDGVVQAPYLPRQD